MAKQIWKFKPTDRWVRTTFKDETIANSKHAMLTLESIGELDYYFPVKDVRMDLLEESASLAL